LAAVARLTRVQIPARAPTQTSNLGNITFSRRKEVSIYHYEKRVLSAIKGIEKSTKISPANKKVLLEYATYLKAVGFYPIISRKPGKLISLSLL
jgi:hypothetical protein